MSRWVNSLVNENKITGCLFDLRVQTVPQGGRYPQTIICLFVNNQLRI